LLYENIVLLFQSRSCQPRLIFFSLDDGSRRVTNKPLGLRPRCSCPDIRGMGLVHRLFHCSCRSVVEFPFAIRSVVCDFNCEEFVEQEFGSSRRPAIKTVWWITAILLVAAFIAIYFYAAR
jgi:hypothetical protein